MSKLVNTDILKYCIEKLKGFFVLAEEGKGLSTNDYNEADKAKVNALPEKTINGATITLNTDSFVANEKPQGPTIVSVQVGHEVLTENVDYVNLSTDAIEAGNYAVVILGIGQYGGQASKSWEITQG